MSAALEYVSEESLPGASAPLLRTEDLTVRFGGLTALNRINFAVERGEIRAIIGPNGAGKSTFFNCLTGVLRPSCPQISYPLPTSSQTLAPTPPKIQPNPSSLSSFFAPLPLLEAFLLTPTPFHLHNCLPTGGFLQTAVSDAPRTTSRTYLRSSHGAHPIQH